MIDANAYPPLIPGNIIDTVRDGLAQFFVHEIVDEHLVRLSLRPPFTAAVAEIANQLLLLGIHRDYGLVSFLERPHPCA